MKVINDNQDKAFLSLSSHTNALKNGINIFEIKERHKCVPDISTDNCKHTAVDHQA